MIKLTQLTIISIFILTLTSCNQDHNDDHSEDHHHNHTSKPTLTQGYQANFVVSNYPLYLLSQAVTTGTPTGVEVLLGAGDVGHHASLSPHDIKLIKNSRYVVWFGKTLESNLTKTLNKIDNNKLITLLDDKNLTLLDQRNQKAQIIKGSIDPHIWLDPNNAKIIVNKLAQLHAHSNPQYAKQYQNNAKIFAKQLDQLVQKYSKQAKISVKNHNNYWVSHDTFHYLENSLNTKMVGALTTSHEVPVKVGQIVWLKRHRPYKNMCLLSQNPLKQGIFEKLQPVNNKVIIEDMSDSKSYLQGWERSAKIVIECLQGK